MAAALRPRQMREAQKFELDDELLCVSSTVMLTNA